MATPVGHVCCVPVETVPERQAAGLWGASNALVMPAVMFTKALPLLLTHSHLACVSDKAVSCLSAEIWACTIHNGRTANTVAAAWGSPKSWQEQLE